MSMLYAFLKSRLGDYTLNVFVQKLQRQKCVVAGLLGTWDGDWIIDLQGVSIPLPFIHRMILLKQLHNARKLT